MSEIVVNKLHTTEMIKAEVMDMLGAGKLLLTRGMVEGLWLVVSPYVKGDVVKQTRHYFMEREEVQDDIDYLVAAEHDFWELIKADREPDLILPGF